MTKKKPRPKAISVCESTHLRVALLTAGRCSIAEWTDQVLNEAAEREEKARRRAEMRRARGSVS